MGYLDNRGLSYFWTKVKNYTKSYVQSYVDQHMPSPGVTSHVGMIVESTTLNTMAKVIAIYGGTSWIQHTGYFLYGASQDVMANQAQADGGEETVTLTAAQSGNQAQTITGGGHVHPVKVRHDNKLDGSGERLGNSYVSDADTIMPIPTSGAHSHTVEAKDATEAHNNMPPYKNVYIWERVA
jgi:hypothetical protein